MPTSRLQLINECMLRPRAKHVHANGPDNVQLCSLDLRRTKLTEYVSVLFTFDGHLPASSWEQSLLPLFEVTGAHLQEVKLPGNVDSSLLKYPICCGRLQLTGNEGHIECNSAGAMFYEAVQSTAVDVSEVALAGTAAAYTQAMDMEQLLLGNAPLLKIQVTYCSDYQTLLGITVARVVTDVTGLVNLLKDWATFHQSLSGQPVFDRQSVQPVQKINSRRPFSSSLYLLGLLCTYLSVWWQLLCEGAFSNYAPLILVIPSSTLQDFKDRINSLALSGPYTLSANDLLCSMLWHASCLVRNRTNSTGIFHMMFDLRQMHVPDDYFGNAHCVLSISDPDRAPIDTKMISQEETEVSVVLTARHVRRAVIDARNEGKSAQEVSQQLKEAGASWLDRTTRTLAQAVLHDATLESWQELYRALPSLDWGAGAPVAVAASKQNKKVEAWTAWWGLNPLTGKAYLHVNVPPRAQKSFQSCHLWQMLPGAYFA